MRPSAAALLFVVGFAVAAGIGGGGAASAQDSGEAQAREPQMILGAGTGANAVTIPVLPGGARRITILGSGGEARVRSVIGDPGGISVHTRREGVKLKPSAANIQKTPSLLRATPSGTPLSLGVDPALEDAIREGQDLILDREYDGAMALFEAVDESHPTSPVGPLGRMLVYQSKMLENGDFAAESDYETAEKEAGERVARTLARGKGDAWDRLMAGGYYGVIAMHAMRKKKYLRAVDDGWDALAHLRWVEEHEPDLADTGMGLGAYDYWRSVITKSVSWLPFFSDKRKPGMEAMERALVDAQYVRPIAQLILIHVYIDERKYQEAIEFAEDMAERYPNNTLARVQLSRAYTRRARYQDALEVLREVERLQPDNKVVKYFIGANLVYQGRELDEADSYLRDFIPDAPGRDWRGWAYERLGDLQMKRGQPAVAVVYFKNAQRDNPGDKSLPKKIERAEKARQKR